MIRHLILAASVIGATWALARDDEHKRERKDKDRRGLAAVADVTWKAECSSCHIAYHPGLLPERSWRKMMTTLDDHFGEDASLEPTQRDEIMRFLVDNAADRSSARRSRKIAASIPNATTPLRLTETQWFRHKHDDIGDKIWKRKAIGSSANCAACHRGAESGNFSEHEVVIPR